jgi:alcohol dehydrogenase YqhD (iron-dependent ADH family)|nr:iron-containing alcohol dehydrogenase [Faecalibacillus intestinalis]
MTYLLNKDETVVDDFSRFALNVMGVKDNGNTLENAKAGIVALQSFIKDELHLPTSLSEVGINDEKFDELKVKACYGQDALPRAYRSLSQKDCLNIYKMCL